MAGPNPLRVLGSILAARWTVTPPRPAGDDRLDHGQLLPVLEEIGGGDAGSLPALAGDLRRYVDRLSGLDPDRLRRPHALAYWLNLYNAGALLLAARAVEEGGDSVLRVPGAFRRPYVTVAGEELSLDAIEHGKIRRFGDPRVHAALVCGSASCPTLRDEPYDGDRLDLQLHHQMRSFLEGGGAVRDGDSLLLSRIFLWYGGDFVRPHRMPTLLPAGRGRVAAALAPWLPEASVPARVQFQDYDWALRCAVG